MLPGASLGECCTAPVAIRITREHVAAKGEEKKCTEYGDPVSAPPIGTLAQSRGGSQIEKSIEMKSFAKSGAFKRNRGAKGGEREVLPLTYLLSGRG